MYIENIKLKKNICFWLAFNYLLLSIMIVVGGLTRLTDSGLSITQWELFSGILPPFTGHEWQRYFDLYKEIPEYKLQNFSMELDEFKVIFWWEFFHRLLGRLIGIFFFVPMIFFTISSSNIPIQILLKPNADAANCEYAEINCSKFKKI